MGSQLLQQFMGSLLRVSQQNKTDFEQINKRKGKNCLIKFMLHLSSHLQIQQSILFAALLIAKRVIDYNIKFTKRNMHKLITVSLLLAQKVYEEEHHNLESYSLLSGIPIQELADIQQKILFITDFQVIVKEQDIAHLQMNNPGAIFRKNEDYQ